MVHRGVAGGFVALRPGGVGMAVRGGHSLVYPYVLVMIFIVALLFTHLHLLGVDCLGMRIIGECM